MFFSATLFLENNGPVCVNGITVGFRLLLMGSSGYPIALSGQL